MDWQWSPFVLGFIGGIAPEIARWKNILSSEKDVKRPGLAYIIASLLYAGIGAILAVFLAKNEIGAFYIGVAWPILLSGADVYIRKLSSDITQLLPKDDRGFGSAVSTWRLFNSSLFLRTKGD